MIHRPGYLELAQKGALWERARVLEDLLNACALCPKRCRVNRNQGELGACGVDSRPKVAAMNIHPWEEPPISGTAGSGAIFFSGCTLQCLFCQNYPISQMGVGRMVSVHDLAEGMLRLQQRGAHNINLVTATHQLPAVVGALCLAVPRGLHVPIVYNTSGYERVKILRLLEGVVDIYLPDIKYDDAAAAQFCSGRDDYVHYSRSALVEMWRQVGALQMDKQGVGVRGMLVRHMVLPNNLSGTRGCLTFLHRRMGPNVWVSLMNQYFPAHKALSLPLLQRKASSREYRQALHILFELGLANGFVQDCPTSDAGEGA